MKDYPISSKIGIVSTIFGIILVSLNWLTGIINDHMTDGASIIILISLITALHANITIAESYKRKKVK